ncbi:MAG TPA: hypothetical protein VMJ35_05455 [Dongiaceae bacterium]|nr:hypothetical protein [Dongiaceae bacterium]
MPFEDAWQPSICYLRNGRTHFEYMGRHAKDKNFFPPLTAEGTAAGFSLVRIAAGVQVAYG